MVFRLSHGVTMVLLAIELRREINNIKDISKSYPENFDKMINGRIPPLPSQLLFLSAMSL